MQRIYSLFILTACLFFLSNCSSSKRDRGEQIIEWINVQQQDSLQAVLHEEFSFTMVDLNRKESNPADHFFDEYLPIVKYMQGKLKIKGRQYKKEKRSEFYKFDAKYYCVYDKYLGTDVYDLTVVMELINNKLVDLRFDTSKGHTQKAERFQEKVGQFEKWLKATHPDESMFDLFDKRDPLLIERMKEYKKGN